jgi:Zn-dependent alcohol dehydrogenase
LVELITSGVCGAQINEIDAIKGPDKFLPHLLGHEGYAQVIEVGPKVMKLAPGDYVIMHWRPSAGIKANPAKYLWRESQLNAGWVTTFNEHAIVSENRLTKIISGSLDPNILPLLGCSLTTSLGVLKNEANVTPQDKILILGAGGVGLALLKVARFLGIKEIVVVDINEKKLEWALEIGATTSVKFTNKTETIQRLSSIYGKGLPSIAIDTTGSSEAIEICYEISSSSSQVILVGVPKIGSVVKIHTLPLHFEKTLKGSEGGKSIPDIDIPYLLDLLKSGRLDLSNFPTKSYSLSAINEAIGELRNGLIGRAIIRF